MVSLLLRRALVRYGSVSTKPMMVPKHHKPGLPMSRSFPMSAMPILAIHTRFQAVPSTRRRYKRIAFRPRVSPPATHNIVMIKAKRHSHCTTPMALRRVPYAPTGGSVKAIQIMMFPDSQDGAGSQAIGTAPTPMSPSLSRYTVVPTVATTIAVIGSK